MMSREVCMLSLTCVSFQVLFMVSIVACGIFDSVSSECGFEFYAENSNLWPSFLTSRVKMPANSLVNIGYIIVGILWLSRVAKLVRVYGKCMKLKPACQLFNESNTYYFTVFCSMAIFYGPIQFLRIATQAHRIAVLDQWMTLPFFAWVMAWSSHLLLNTSKTFSMCLWCGSILSYATTLVSKLGFEYILAFHVFGTFATGIIIQRRLGNCASHIEMLKAVLCCCGFILLKILDMRLAYWSMFQVLSGHFWSKLCDILQIHFACNFFSIITLLRNYEENKVDNKKLK